MNRQLPLRLALGAGSLLMAAVLLGVVFPHVANAGWDDVSDQVASIAPGRLLELTGIWAAGLYIYTFALTAALPGLARRRALALNLGGSSVSNVIPFGGAAGIGLNYAMLRSWGYDRSRVAAFTIVSQAVAAVVKAVIAVGGAVALLTLPGVRQLLPHPEESAWVGIAAVPTLCLLTTVLLRRQIGQLPVWAKVRAQLTGVASHIAAMLRRQWLPLTVGAFGYAALQLVLFELCLSAVHANLSVAVVAAGYAVDRLLTLVPITPGGAGVVEAGVTAVLVALGGDPAAVATGVVLFRAFSFFAEIPIGGAVAVGWFTQRSIRMRATVEPAS